MPLLVVALLLIAGGLALHSIRPRLPRWPLDDDGEGGPPHVTSEFRPAHRPDHHGIDLRARTPLPCYACVHGVVRVADRQNDSSAGLRVEIEGRGEHFGITVRPFHLSRVDVEVGQIVSPDSRVGLTGATNGTAEGGQPHLHFETRTATGAAYDPRTVLPPLPAPAVS